LQHDDKAQESAKPNASWQIEIPVKSHNDVQQLHLRIDRGWIEEQNTPERKSETTKVKQWSVTLRFDLPTRGEFCAQFSIVNSSMNATLWAAQDKTLAEIKSHLSSLRKQLEDQGIQITNLQCVKGMPPEKPITLGYSLIDVST
jgi:Flagellar hook-length control protein FliK